MRTFHSYTQSRAFGSNLAITVNLLVFIIIIELDKGPFMGAPNVKALRNTVF